MLLCAMAHDPTDTIIRSLQHMARLIAAKYETEHGKPADVVISLCDGQRLYGGTNCERQSSIDLLRSSLDEIDPVKPTSTTLQ